MLTAGIGFRIKNVFVEKVKLDKELLNQRKHQLQAYIEGTEKERNRIAMELHDDIASRLSCFNRLVESKISLQEREQILTLTKDVRSLSHELSPLSPDADHLEEHLRHLLKDSSRNSNIQFELRVIDYPQDAEYNLTVNIYRIVQEAIVNIEKHSKAEFADIQIIAHQDEIILTIEDNGKGLCKSMLHKGIGLKNMQTRVQFLEGNFHIDSAPNKGTTLLITIPLKKE